MQVRVAVLKFLTTRFPLSSAFSYFQLEQALVRPWVLLADFSTDLFPWMIVVLRGMPWM
jgi:hypothetical protein